MRPDQENPQIQLFKELGTLEDAYAEALGDEMDAASLTRVWERIKALRKKMGSEGEETKTDA